MKGATHRPLSQTDGFLALYKPKCLTSMDVLRRIKRLTGIRKRIGHGGTLDPLAEGVLPVCFGQATRLMEYLINDTKEYLMEIQLGVATDTYDAEGTVTFEKTPAAVTEKQIHESLGLFRGVFQQRPPIHSALKKDGRRLYEFARKGVHVEVEPRNVEVTSLELIKFVSPTLTLKAECGRGVYMRSLAHDLGQVLGCGAYVSRLVRTRTGPFDMDNSVTLAQFEEAAAEGSWRDLLRPLDSLLLHMKSLVIDENAERHLRQGQSISLASQHIYAGYLESCRIYSSDGRFVAVVRFDRTNNRWDPHKVFRLAVASPYAP